MVKQVCPVDYAVMQGYRALAYDVIKLLNWLIILQNLVLSPLLHNCDGLK